MIRIQKTITILAAICLIGTMGGVEWGQFGWGRALLQSAGFLALMIYSYKVELALEKLRKLEKRQRLPHIITVGNGTNYKVRQASKEEAIR